MWRRRSHRIRRPEPGSAILRTATSPSSLPGSESDQCETKHHSLESPNERGVRSRWAGRSRGRVQHSELAVERELPEDFENDL